MESFKQISVEEAKKLIDGGNVTIVDVRDPDSFQAGHIREAIAVNDQNIAEFVKATDKNKPLLCYCYHGFSSQGAAEYFKQNGFKETFSLEGGFEAWKAECPFTFD